MLFGFVDEADGARQARIAPHGARLYAHEAVAVQRAAEYAVAGDFANRHGFARYDGLVHRRFALYDFAVAGKRRARPYRHDVAHLEFVVHELFQFHETLHAFARPAHGEGLQFLSESHDERDFAGGKRLAYRKGGYHGQRNEKRRSNAPFGEERAKSLVSERQTRKDDRHERRVGVSHMHALEVVRQPNRHAYAADEQNPPILELFAEGGKHLVDFRPPR